LALARGLLVAALWATPAAAQERDVNKLFATTCGFCHEAGGRKAGKGPQLMNTEKDDATLRARIKTGVPGRMPAFGRALTEADLDRIVRYIRDLKPDA
jgi:mono/diheme cytochrome c family protein